MKGDFFFGIKRTSFEARLFFVTKERTFGESSWWTLNTSRVKNRVPLVVESILKRS